MGEATYMYCFDVSCKTIIVLYASVELKFPKMRIPWAGMLVGKFQLNP